MGKKRERPALSDAEWEVMNVIWDHGDMAGRDIHARLPAERRWAHATVKTLLRRMVAKGWLEYRQVGNSYLYRAAVPRARATRSAIAEFSARVLGGVLTPFVAYFAEQNKLNLKEIEKLEKILNEHKRKRSN